MERFKQRARRAGLMLAAVLLAGFVAAPNVLAVSLDFTDSWQEAASLPAATAYASSAAVNGYIYEVGGRDSGGTPISTVDFVKPDNSGYVDNWQATTALPAAQAYAAIATYNNYIYVIGGQDTSGVTNNIYYAKPANDGTISAWQISTIPTGVAEASAVVVNGYLYVFGGYNSSYVALDSVQFAPINSDGSLGSWGTTTSMPAGEYSFSAATNDGYVYITDGNTIFSAQQQSNGQLGSWTSSTNSLPYLLDASIVTNGDYLYIMGGTDTSTNTLYDNVYYAEMEGNGTLGPWQTSGQPLSDPTYAATAVLSDDPFVYLIGGYTSSGNTASVYYNTLAAATVSGGSSNNSPTGSNTTGLPTAPDTGYGQRSGLNPAITLLAAGAVITSGTGLALLWSREILQISK